MRGKNMKIVLNLQKLTLIYRHHDANMMLTSTFSGICPVGGGTSENDQFAME
jgi:hypothetical protein